MYKLIIFDLDGTVLDTLDDMHSSLMETLDKFGIEKFPITKTQSFVGDGISKLIERAVTSERYTKDIEQYFRDIYNKRLVETTQPYDGIIDVFQRLKESEIIMTVLSNKATQYTDSIVKHFGLDQYLTSWYGFDSFQEKKPSPQPVREILRITGVSPENALMIGDNYTDIESGSLAGIKTCFCKYGYGKLRSIKADYYIDLPSEIPLIAGI